MPISLLVLRSTGPGSERECGWDDIQAISSATAAAAAIAVTAAAAEPKTIKDGIAAWQRSDYAQAVAIWRPLAEKGDSDAQFNLGQAYRLGRGVTVDLATAQSWLEKAAKAGHLDAQTTLGLLLFDSGSRDRAIQWLKKAAEQGDARAMLVYGTALFNGDGAPRDPVMAYAYVSRSAAQGLAQAKTTLGEMDKVIPLDIRQKGVAIARGKAKIAPARGETAPAKEAAKAKPDTAAAAVAKPSPKPPVPAAASGAWRVQLGAFAKRSTAEALYSRLSGTAPVQGHGAFYIAAGSVTRLQIGPFQSRAAAVNACSALSSNGQACFPVEAK